MVLFGVWEEIKVSFLYLHLHKAINRCSVKIYCIIWQSHFLGSSPSAIVAYCNDAHYVHIVCVRLDLNNSFVFRRFQLLCAFSKNNKYFWSNAANEAMNWDSVEISSFEMIHLATQQQKQKQMKKICIQEMTHAYLAILFVAIFFK